MIGGHLTVGVYGDGLIARIGAQDMDAATTQPGVRPFDMTGRPMRGIVVIDSSVLDDQALEPLDRAGPRLRGRLAAEIAQSPRAASPQQPPPRLRDARNAACEDGCTDRMDQNWGTTQSAIRLSRRARPSCEGLADG